MLALPSDHGFDLAAYLVPLAVLLGLRRSCSRCCCRAGAGAREAGRTTPAGSLSAGDSARLDADMARFD